MDAVRQSCRPKHQVLILKCYPKYQKGAVDVRPNASELSYLLYYASTRRSKVQKVGVFLEKRTARDVWRGKIGNVIVTLHILQALIEKCPADLPLYAESVLTILDTVLRSNDLTLVEESIGPFAAFCKFQDPNLLAAEHAFVNHYREVVRTYASFASNDPASTSAANSNANAAAAVAAASRNNSSLSILLRWKTAGLRAIQAVVSIEDLGTDAMNQLDIVLPPLLEIIYTYSFANHSAEISEKSSASHSDIIHARIQALDEADRELSVSAHRKSVRTIDSVDAADAASTAAAAAHEEAQNADQAVHPLNDVTASATAAAAAADAANDNASDDEKNSQKSAEMAVRALALGCLQRIYATASNTGHIRNTTSQILRFIVARQPDWTTGSVNTSPSATVESTVASASSPAVAGCSWGRHLLAIIARSTPVQNRFIILLAAMESLLNTPMLTRKMPAQLMLASLVDGLLSGPNNLIGLSVMDVLIGLLQHLLLLLRVTTGRTKRVLHRQATSGFIRYSLTGVDGDGVVRGSKQNRGGGASSKKTTAAMAAATQKNEDEKAHTHQRSKSITLTDEDAISDPERRAELANLLQLCIGHLATHIYYADQVSDIVSMILSRIKPVTSIMELSDSSVEADANPNVTANTTANAGRDATSSSPVTIANGTATPDHEQERLFAFPESQISALRSVKNVLCVANSRSSPAINPAGIPTMTNSESRNKVPISAWEDTQWMVCDSDIGVQTGYIDALVTWLKSETTADDLRVVESRKRHAGSASALNSLTAGGGGGAAAAATRPFTAHPSAAANGNGHNDHGHNGNPTDSSERLYRTIADTVTAAHRDQAASIASQFLSLLHIAVYDSASSVSGNGDVAEESGVLRLHLVLATLVDKLGVNAIRHGLPMIMRLQEEFVVAGQAAASTPGTAAADNEKCECSVSKAARAVVGTLVHGYLLAIVQRFELYGSSVGREITQEVERRKDKNCWLRGMSIPPLSLGKIDELARSQGEKGGWGASVPETATLHPFSNVGGLADLIEESYNAVATQSFHPSSLDGSTLVRPSTAASTHSKSWQQAYHAHALAQPLPASVKETMTMSWTKDNALAAAEANEPNVQPSLSDSRTNTNLGLSTGAGRNYLSDALGHRYGASSSGSIRRLRAGTALSSVDTSPSAKPADDAAAVRRSVSLRNGRAGHMSGLTRRGSMPDEHRLSVGTTYTIRMDELRHALSISNAESHDRSTALPKQRRRQSGGHASNVTGRRESSSMSSTYSDHPSLISAHSGLPPTANAGPSITADPRQYSEHLQTIESIPPVPPIPPDYNTPSGSQSSISRPSTARAPPTNGGLVPPQSVKNRSNTINGATASYPSSPASKRVSGGGKRISSVASVKTATQPTTGSYQDGARQPGGRARHSNSVRSDRTLSLCRRADVERLINGLLDHANSRDSSDPLDYDEFGGATTGNNNNYINTLHQQHASLAQSFSKSKNGTAGPQRPALNTSINPLGLPGSAPVTPVMKTSLDKPATATTTATPGHETGAAAGAGSEAEATPGSGGSGSGSGVPSFFHDDADFHLRAPSGTTSPQQQQQQREQRAALLASLGSKLGSSNRDNVVRPPY